jgi:hypothetical protein
MSTATAARVGGAGHGTELARVRWADYLRTVSQACLGAPTVLEARGAPDRVPFPSRSDGARLRELRFDSRGDLLEVALGGSDQDGAALRCFISAPRRIVASYAEAWRSIFVIADGGAWMSIRILAA